MAAANARDAGTSASSCHLPSHCARGLSCGAAIYHPGTAGASRPCGVGAFGRDVAHVLDAQRPISSRLSAGVAARRDEHGASGRGRQRRFLPALPHLERQPRPRLRGQGWPGDRALQAGPRGRSRDQPSIRRGRSACARTPAAAGPSASSPSVTARPSTAATAPATSFGAYDVHADRLRVRLRPRRRASDNLAFMRQISGCYPKRTRIYWIRDNLSANWMTCDPRVRRRQQHRTGPIPDLRQLSKTASSATSCRSASSSSKTPTTWGLACLQLRPGRPHHRPQRPPPRPTPHRHRTPPANRRLNDADFTSELPRRSSSARIAGFGSRGLAAQPVQRRRTPAALLASLTARSQATSAASAQTSAAGTGRRSSSSRTA